ncbi:hypothetical protein RE9425_03350 [Prescottella equi]|nr:hypothetical protein RE9425_03350 [Prescottella equi]
MDTGVVQDIIRSGRNSYVTEEEAARLEAIPYVEEPHEPALLVKVGPAKPDPGDRERDWMGWNPDASPNDDKQMKGVGRWWQVRDPNRYQGHLFVPIVAGFVLAVYEVIDYDTGPRQLREFKLQHLDGERAEPFLGHRVVSKVGAFTDPR